MTTSLAQSRPAVATRRRGLPALRPIRNDKELDAATALAERLEARADLGDLPDRARDYLEVLTVLIERYNDEHYPIAELPSVRARLKALCEAAGMNASDLGRLLGNRALGNKLLRGEREASKAHVRRLAEHFKLSPAYFL